MASVGSIAGFPENGSTNWYKLFQNLLGKIYTEYDDVVNTYMKTKYYIFTDRLRTQTRQNAKVDLPHISLRR